jgi:hypothetical protein
MKLVALLFLVGCGTVWDDVSTRETMFTEPAFVGTKLTIGSEFRKTIVYARMQTDAMCVLIHEDAGSSPDGTKMVDESVRALAIAPEGTPTD